MEKRKNILLAAISVSLFICTHSVKAAEVSNWTELQQAIQNGTSPIDITGNITRNTDMSLGNLGGSNVTINGNGYDIDGADKPGSDAIYGPISVNNGQTLTINNVGSDNTTGFSNFRAIYGGVIELQMTSNSNLTINNSVFSDNIGTDWGGVIQSNGENNIVSIVGSKFINNSAGFGGVISAHNGKSSVTIVDSEFLGNGSSNEGGAICNVGSTVNIIADKADTVFTGNTQRGSISNALENFRLNSNIGRSTMNLNAGEHSVIINDGITGSDAASSTYNINSSGIKMPDGTNAPNTGVVELNNTATNSKVNLYNGTLKLGHYEGGTITKSDGTQTQVAASVGNLDSSINFNANGGKLSVENDGVTTQNLGNVTLNSDLSTEIALDTIGSNSLLSADSVNANNHKIIISDINVGSSDSLVSNKVITTDTDLLGNIAVSDNVTVSGDNLEGKNILLGYTLDNTQLLLSAGASTLAQAVQDTMAERIYSMSADENVTTNLGEMGGGEGATLTINGNAHDITANSDGISGIIINNNQTLNINNVGNKNDEESQGINNFSYMTIINDNGGSLNIDNSVLKNNIAAKDDFAGAINNHGTTVISNTLIEGNKAPTVGAVGNYGTMTIIDSEFRDNSATLSAASLSVGAIGNTSILNIIANDANTTFTGNKNAKNEFNALNNQGGTVNINAGSGKVVFDDSIDGLNGTINVNAGSDVTGINAPTTGTIAINNEVKNNTVNMYNGTLNFGTNTQNGTLYSGNFADSVNFNYNGGTVSLQNSAINSANLGNLTLNSDMDLRLDANLADQTMDTITASSFNANGNNINISNILITQPTTEKTFSISPLGTGMDEAVKTALAGAIQYTGGDIAYSPIYKYSASYDPVSAMMNFGLYGAGRGGEPGYDSFTPDVMASPVAAQLGGYLVQLNSYDNAFRNMDMYMLMTKEQRQAMKMRNRYAAGNDADIVYDPTVTQYENKAGWFRPYATFENVPLNNGPDVSNVSYGSFFGGESELYDLGHGWDGMWGIYAGYNGSHQAYDGVSIWQNGGTLGAVGMAYKGNFFTGLTANVGASAGEASAMFGSEDFTMLMSGIASKTGYNWELAKGKFIIQPSLLMSYSFINTFDYHNAAGVSINSDPLHAIQLEPGIKFIGNLKNGWQPYLGVSVVWNIMDRTQFQANNVSLPSLSIDPFVKYGVGVRKAWGEKFTGFFQTYITNGGRNGVGLQAGFRWTLGKSNSKKQKAKNHTPELPKAKVTLKSMSMK